MKLFVIAWKFPDSSKKPRMLYFQFQSPQVRTVSLHFHYLKSNAVYETLGVCLQVDLAIMRLIYNVGAKNYFSIQLLSQLFSINSLQQALQEKVNPTMKENVLLLGKRNQLRRRKLKQKLFRFLLHLFVVSALILKVTVWKT